MSEPLVLTRNNMRWIFAHSKVRELYLREDFQWRNECTIFAKKKDLDLVGDAVKAHACVGQNISVKRMRFWHRWLHERLI